MLEWQVVQPRLSCAPSPVAGAAVPGKDRENSNPRRARAGGPGVEKSAETRAASVHCALVTVLSSGAPGRQARCEQRRDAPDMGGQTQLAAGIASCSAAGAWVCPKGALRAPDADEQRRPQGCVRAAVWDDAVDAKLTV